MTDQKTINDAVWRACDTFRGTIDATMYKDYILVMLFVKYLSDLHKEKAGEYRKRYGGDEARVARAMARERFSLPEHCDFDHLYAQRKQPNIGDRINKALAAIEDANKAKLEGVFRNIVSTAKRTWARPRIAMPACSPAEDFNDLGSI